MNQPTLGASSFALGLKPPYYAVVFSSQRTRGGPGYSAMADRMIELAMQQPGYLGVESTRGADGFGITVSYWESAEAISSWKANLEHQVAQAKGKSDWYAHYELRVAKVERAYSKGLATYLHNTPAHASSSPPRPLGGEGRGEGVA